MIIFISIFIMILPMFIKDNKNKVNYLQYISKIGREILNKKIISGIIILGIVSAIVSMLVSTRVDTYMYTVTNIIYIL